MMEHEGDSDTNCGTAPNGLERERDEMEISGRIETIQTTALFRSARILRKVLET